MADAIVTGRCLRILHEAADEDGIIVEPPKPMGRPRVDFCDVLLAGIVMGMTKLSAREVVKRIPANALSSKRTPSSQAVSRRLATDMIGEVFQVLHGSAALVRTTPAPVVVTVDQSAPLLPQLVAQVGIGRARRKNDRGLLVDAMCRAIAANVRIFTVWADQPAPATPESEPEPVRAEPWAVDQFMLL